MAITQESPQLPRHDGLGGDDTVPPPLRIERARRRRTRPRRRRGRDPGAGVGWVTRSAATAWITVLVVAPMLVVTFTVWGGIHRPVTPDQASVALLKVALVACLSFMPGWLYVRFLGRRAGVLWNEYVLNLHRLAWDRPEYLPEPPADSQFHADWCRRGGAEFDRRRNVYTQKFCAYFGRAVSTSEPDDSIVRTDTMFPVFMATAFISTAWTAVLWDVTFITAPSTAWDVLKFAFLGAYVFTMQSLVRRFFQSDLRPSAYASALLRFIVVLAATAALVQLAAEPGPTEAAVAFVIGIFPVVAVQALQRAASALLGVVVPTATADYPLNQLDGLDLWYEARLLEEGIEDMQNLTTANMVDVMLHSRVPVARLVDWVDQAYLYLHLDRAERGVGERRQVDRALRAQRAAMAAAGDGDGDGVDVAPSVPDLVKGSMTPHSRAGTQTRMALRQLGIRTATGLLKVFPPDQMAPCRRADCEGRCLSCRLPEAGLDPFQVQTLVRVLDREPGLAPVWNWQASGVPRHRAAGPTRHR